MEPVRLHPACIRCLLEKQLASFPDGIGVEEEIEYMQRVLRVIADAPKTASAPVLVHDIGRIQKEMFGYEPDYSAVKAHFNGVMLAKAEEIEERLRGAADPLKRAIQYAMTGNYIDFGAMQKVEEEQLERLLERSQEIAVDPKEYEALRRELLAGRNVVYLTDNCGEIVLDKLLMKEILRQNPQARITAIVRGAPALNDATVEDAQQVGLSQVARVIGNGSAIAGTCLDKICRQAKDAIDAADVILAKGQANFETLRGCGKNVFYIFMCKCGLFSSRFQVPLFHGMLVHDKNS